MPRRRAVPVWLARADLALAVDALRASAPGGGPAPVRRGLPLDVRASALEDRCARLERALRILCREIAAAARPGSDLVVAAAVLERELLPAPSAGG